MNTTTPISAVLIVNNEADNIVACLKAILQVTTDIVVVDSGSTDATPQLCEQLGAKVFHYGWKGYAQNKNFGNQQCQHDWILSIDADEVLSETLIDTIKNLNPKANEIYSLDRLTNFCGDWIHHSGWYPDWKTRIFNRKTIAWKGDYVHEKLAIPKHYKIVKLEGKLYHYSYKSLADHLARIKYYANLSAEELHAKGKKATIIKRFGSPIFRFIRTYFIKLGCLDGKNGFIISKRNAYLVYLKYYYLSLKNRTF